MARMPGDFYYGFEPPEPLPIGECAFCGEEVYNDDYMIDGELACCACRDYFESDEIVLDFAVTYPGSWFHFLRDNCDQEWFEQMTRAAKEYYYDEMAEYLKIKNETPCGNTTPRNRKDI